MSDLGKTLHHGEHVFRMRYEPLEKIWVLRGPGKSTGDQTQWLAEIKKGRANSIEDAVEQAQTFLDKEWEKAQP